MLPNRFPDEGQAPEYNTVDDTQWCVEAVRAYREAPGDDALPRDLFPVLQEIVDWHVRGTRGQIHLDPADGLLYAGESGVHLTWMDADGGGSPECVERDRGRLMRPCIRARTVCGGPSLSILDVVHRRGVPEPWAEGEKIPWNDPDFGRRMLREHLSQEHDAASRRFGIVDGQVRWIHAHLLKGTPARILDLGCGPGLYTNRLARLGHCCAGIDFSPASIAYAQEQAAREGLGATYHQQDIRMADYGHGYVLVMLIFGEINVFRPIEARGILEKAYRALVPGGLLLLEPHTFEAVRRIGRQPPSWYCVQSGLFSDEPHLCLQENFWDDEAHVAIERYYIIDAATGEVARHSASTQAYTDDEYRSLLAECGFGEVELGLPMGWSTGEDGTDLTLVLSRKMP